MFDSVGDGDPVDAMGAAARAESAAIARRLSAAGELYARRSCEWAGRELWCADPFEAVAAEVSAAQNISRGRAGTQIRYALELRDRLPGVAAVFAAGEVDFRMVSTIINRTSNVTDESIGAIDAALARLAPRWMRRSDALGALAAGADRPMCTCANPDCPAAGAAPVVIHLLAERATLEADGASPGYLPGFAHPARRDGPRAGPGRPTHAAGRARRPRTRLPPVGGAGPVHPVAPPELPVARLRGPSLRHRPHRALSAGPTHPSKLQAVLPCTPLGENVLQRPRRLDRPPAHGTITVIAPTGHRCRTEPAGAQLFAALGTPTGTPHLPADTGPPDPHRDRAAPTRDRIRNQDRRTRIDRERRARSQINAERTRQHHIRITAAQAADPPPF